MIKQLLRRLILWAIRNDLPQRGVHNPSRDELRAMLRDINQRFG
jgi:hypothetical protein